MSTSSDLTPLLVAALPGAAFWIKRRLSRAIQPLRLEVAREGEMLLARPDLPQSTRQTVEWMIESTFGTFWLHVAALFFTPAIAVALLFSGRARRAFLTNDCPADYAAPYSRISELSSRLEFINHPLLHPLVLSWMLLWIGPVVVCASLIRLVPPKSINTQAILVAAGHKLPHHGFAPA